MPIKVRGELSLDGSGWDATLKKAESQVEHFGREGLGELKNSIAGAFAAGAIVEFIKSIGEGAEHIKQMAEQFSISTTEVQKLGLAAKHLGLEFEDVGVAIDKLGALRKKAGENASAADNEALEVLQRYGISLHEVNDANVTNLDLLKKVGAALNGLELNSAQRQDLREMFGRGGARLGELVQHANEPATVDPLTPEAVENLAAASKDTADAWQKIKTAAGNFFGLLTYNNRRAIGEDFRKRQAEELRQYMEQKKETEELIARTDGKLGPIAAALVSPPPLFEDKAAKKKALEDEKTIAEQMRKLDELSERHALAQLTHTERRALLEKDIARLKQEAGSADNVISENKTKILIAEKQLELDALARHVRAPEDSLVKVGNFLGGGTTTIANIAQKTNEWLARIHHALTNPGPSGGHGAGATGVPPT